MLKLEGRLVGPWVDEVERACSGFIVNQRADGVTFDLSGVTSIDERGKELIRQILQQGGHFGSQVV